MAADIHVLEDLLPYASTGTAAGERRTEVKREDSLGAQHCRACNDRQGRPSFSSLERTTANEARMTSRTSGVWTGTDASVRSPTSSTSSPAADIARMPKGRSRMH